MGLDLAPTTVEPVSGRALRRQLLLTLGLIVAMGLALIGAGVLAWNTIVYVQTDRGSCLSFDPMQCRSLTLETIEEEGRVALPEGSRVLDSGSTSAFVSQRAFAVVEIPEGADVQLDPRYAPSEHRSSVSEKRFDSIDERWSFNESLWYTVLTGTGVDGARIVQIEVID